MALAGAILLAIFVLSAPWGVVAILGGVGIEVGEAWFWIHFSRRRRAVTGAEGMIGRLAEVVEPCRPRGRVRVHGELWRARCEEGAEAGETVVVLGVHGLTLEVEIR
jgi:membrane-bound serine protease (ClpP class)